ncbi:viral A-type inclusion protein [Reticulomyxa filosa]|uniref:Viral A-type inclusion protein n=1 Tax=Reticulomyxa filosa TaxID=46433 RepID=X6NK16_RETFI|nr:viral A-type inclusion protein [Reticulomyxa filosa]|eukprot:ETO26316.1 viral A-type inclusion protein [Reticulomyxa filosa]
MTRRLAELEQKTNERTKSMYDERQKRIKANQEKNEIRGKLLKVQKMVSARLKLLGIDLSNTDNMAEALDAALQAIQKLTIQLSEKEEILNELTKERDGLKASSEQQVLELRKLHESMEPLKDENVALKKQVKETNGNVKDLSGRLETLSDEKTQLAKELQNMERIMTKTTGADKQMIDRLNDKINESEKRYQDQKHTIENLNKHVNDLKEGMSDQKVAYEKQVAQLEFDVSQLQQHKIKLEQDVENYNKKYTDQQKNMEELNHNTDEMKLQFASAKAEYENKLESMSDVIDSLKGTKLQLENKVAELEDHCANHKTTIDELNREIAKLKAENEQLKNQLSNRNDSIDEQMKKLQALEDELKSKQKTIEELQERLNQMQQTTERNLQDFETQKTHLESQLHQYKEQNESVLFCFRLYVILSSSIIRLEQNSTEKEEKIKQLQLEQEKFAMETKEEKKQMETKMETLKFESEKVTQSKNVEIDDLSTQHKNIQSDLQNVKLELQQANERWQAIINRPREDKEVQTTMVGSEMNDVFVENPRLKEQVKQLQNKLTRIEAVIENLTTENKQLLTDMNDLIKKAAKFLPDSSTHKGEILAMSTSPTRLIVATSATDKTIRLWQVHTDAPDSGNENSTELPTPLEVTLPGSAALTTATPAEHSENKSPKKANTKSCEPYARSNVDSKVQALCFSPCGKYLAAGTNYCDTPDGYVVIWSVNNDATEGYVVHAFRSRPTVRFAGVRSVCFGMDTKGSNGHYSQLLFAGDVNGIVWCFNTEREQLIGKIQHHKDVIYGVGCGENGWLYSVSHDQHLCAFDLSLVELDVDFSAVIPINEVMRDILDSNSSSGNKLHVRVKSQGKPPSRRTSMRETSASPHKPQMSGKRPSAKNIKSDDVKRDENDDGLPEYKGQSVAEDTQYPFWCIAVSVDGAHVATGNRKLRVFSSKSAQESGEMTEPVKFTDTDTEHIKGIDCRFGMAIVTRRQVPRCKIFDLASGKELFKFTCKEKDGGYVFATFLCDRKHVVAMTQVLAKEPSPPVMKVYSYT